MDNKATPPKRGKTAPHQGYERRTTQRSTADQVSTQKEEGEPPLHALNFYFHLVQFDSVKSSYISRIFLLKFCWRERQHHSKEAEDGSTTHNGKGESITTNSRRQSSTTQKNQGSSTQTQRRKARATALYSNLPYFTRIWFTSSWLEFVKYLSEISSQKVRTAAGGGTQHHTKEGTRKAAPKEKTSPPKVVEADR